MERQFISTKQNYFLQAGKCSLALLALSLGATTAWVSSAWAQDDVVTDTEETDNPRQSRQIEEIVVKARRREENLQDVPITIQAISEATLKDAAISGIKEISQYSPGLTISEDVDNNGARIFIRGVGTSTPVFGSEVAVPIYIDDIYTPLGLGANLELFSIDRVEVLSGPQGTLYGRNSFGGAVKIYSKEFTNETEVDLTAQYGSFNQRNLKAEVRSPVIPDRLWLGAAFASFKNDGIQEFTELNSRGWQDDKELYRFRMEARPSDSLTMKATYSRSDSQGVAKQPKFEPGTNGDLSGLFLTGLTNIGDQIDSNPVLTDDDPDHIPTNIDADNSAVVTGYTWQADYALNDTMNIIYLGGDHRLDNIRAFDNDGSPAPFLDAIQSITLEGQSHELQFQWNTGRYNVIVGGFYYDEDTEVYGLIHSGFAAAFIDAQDPDALSVVTDINGLNTGVNAGTYSNDVIQNTESLAFYGNFGIDITDQLRGTLGLRWTRDDKFTDSPVEGQNFVVNRSLSPLSGDVVPSGGLREIPLPGGLSDPNNFGQDTTGFDLTGVSGVDEFGITGPAERTFEEVTVEATLDYQLTPDTLTYTSFKQGFQGGQLFPNALANLIDENFDAFDNFEQSTSEQKLNAYELGLKTTLLDGRWQFNGAVYYYDFEDLIISVLTPVPTDVVVTGFLPVPQNAGKARSIGFDFDTTFSITDNLIVRANLGFVDFKLQEVQSSTTDADGNTSTENIADTFDDKYVSGAPRWQGALGIQYFAPPTKYARARLWTNLAFRGRMNTNGGNPAATTGFGLIPETASRDSFISDAHENLSAGITLRPPVDERWRLDISGSNLLDQRRFESTPFDSTGLLGLPHGYNRPRTWLLSVSYSQ